MRAPLEASRARQFRSIREPDATGFHAFAIHAELLKITQVLIPEAVWPSAFRLFGSPDPPNLFHSLRQRFFTAFLRGVVIAAPL